MRDAIGNTIKIGDIIDWQFPKDVPSVMASVVNLSDGGLSMGSTGQMTPPFISIRIDLPINVDVGNNTSNAVVSSMRCLRNPLEEAANMQLSNVAPAGRPQ